MAINGEILDIDPVPVLWCNLNLFVGLNSRNVSLETELVCSPREFKIILFFMKHDRKITNKIWRNFFLHKDWLSDFFRHHAVVAYVSSIIKNVLFHYIVLRA